METEGTPTPDDARRLLHEAAAAEDSVRYPPLPLWFFISMSVAIAAIFVAQLLPTPHSLYASFAVAVAAVVMGLRFWINGRGVAWVSVKASHIAPFVGGILAIAVVCIAVAELSGAEWIWIVGAVIAASIVMLTGRAYRRMVGARG